LSMIHCIIIILIYFVRKIFCVNYHQTTLVLLNETHSFKGGRNILI
jgi:hypothetical protein